MDLGEDFEIGHSRHGAVVFHDFADDAGVDFGAGEFGQIDASFSLSDSDEYAAIASDDWEHVPRSG